MKTQNQIQLLSFRRLSEFNGGKIKITKVKVTKAVIKAEIPTIGDPKKIHLEGTVVEASFGFTWTSD